MKKLVMKSLTASHEALRWIENLLYRPGGPGLPINKRMVALVVLLVICVFSAAADDFGLDEKIGMALQMLSSPWVKGIALIVECIGLITAGRQEPGMFGPARGLKSSSPGSPALSSLWPRGLSPASLSQWRRTPLTPPWSLSNGFLAGLLPPGPQELRTPRVLQQPDLLLGIPKPVIALILCMTMILVYASSIRGVLSFASWGAVIAQDREQ